MGDTGSIITFYDSLLVKITTSGPNLNQALDRMHRALREMYTGGYDQHTVFGNVICTRNSLGRASTKMIDVTLNFSVSRQEETGHPVFLIILVKLW